VTGTTWYRYHDVAYSTGYDEFTDRSTGSVIEVELKEYEVLRHTPKGVWINASPFRSSTSLKDLADEKFVLLSARKRFAHPTRKEAMTSFLARKKAQIRIYEARISRAKTALRKGIEIGSELSHASRDNNNVDW
jgi:hypothetical protein